MSAAHDISTADTTAENPAATTTPAAAVDAPGEAAAVEADTLSGVGTRARFEVHLDDFDGPFDLLLGLIAKHKLDVTTLSLSRVTDDFIAYLRSRGSDWDLDQTTDFLVVAATLLDLKAARLLPAAEVEDEEDLALLEVRDLLFARLLQYRAYKQAAIELADRYAAAALRFPRSVSLEPAFAELLPEVLLSVSPDRFAALAVRALTPREPPTVSIDHLHEVRVSVREQAAVVVARLRELRQTTFRTLVADCPDTLTIVARFLALLELFRDGLVLFEQDAPLAELTINWVGADEGEVALSDEFDVAETRRGAERAADPEEHGEHDPADAPARDGAAADETAERKA